MPSPIVRGVSSRPTRKPLSAATVCRKLGGGLARQYTDAERDQKTRKFPRYTILSRAVAQADADVAGIFQESGGAAAFATSACVFCVYPMCPLCCGRCTGAGFIAEARSGTRECTLRQSSGAVKTASCADYLFAAADQVFWLALEKLVKNFTISTDCRRIQQQNTILTFYETSSTSDRVPGELQQSPCPFFSRRDIA